MSRARSWSSWRWRWSPSWRWWVWSWTGASPGASSVTPRMRRTPPRRRVPLCLPSGSPAWCRPRRTRMSPQPCCWPPRRTPSTRRRRGTPISTEACSAEAGCDVIPVTVPLTIVECDGTNGSVSPVDPPTTWTATETPIVVPLCVNGPGNVGWLDWTPTAGGTPELEQSIRYPDNDEMTIPDWFYVTSTGDVNSKLIEDALNETWGGKVVLFPQFDLTCDAQPRGPGLDDCPAGHVGGNGQQQWYHLPQFAAFQFCGGTPNWCDGSGGGTTYGQGAYITGNDKATCDTGNGATSCLVGRFVNFIGGPHTVGARSGAPSPPHHIVR